MRWPRYDHILFDCDSTLTGVEGIDVLAASKGKGWRIKVLTDAAMNGDLDLEDVYDRRLQALRPTRGQIKALRQVYKNHAVPDAAAVIDLLQRLGHKVYIISGGLLEPVVEFGVYLGVPPAHIRAVGVTYDQLAGDWWATTTAETNAAARYLAHAGEALTLSDGKAQIVRELLGDQPGRSLLVGDGTSDLLAGSAVDLFVGFGGVVERARVATEAPAYLRSAGMAPLLFLAAGPAVRQRLTAEADLALYERARQSIATGAITFRDDRLQAKFHDACEAVYSRTDGGPPRDPRRPG